MRISDWSSDVCSSDLQAGGSLDEIVTAVKKVSDIVAEIAAASTEQARGLEEVNGAVVNMDEMTPRNGALVEETNASAQAMADQARPLAALVGHFTLDGSSAVRPVGEAWVSWCSYWWAASHSKKKN